MGNERKTENIVRDRLRELGYYDPFQEIRVEEQQSDLPRIKKLLKLASKKGQGIGYPEFIITSAKRSELLIVIECKADSKKHISETLEQYSDYAVDGALLYASYLSKDYDVIAIGVSGQTMQEVRISHYICLKGSINKRDFLSDKLLSFSDYYSAYITDPTKFHQEYTKLLGYSKDLNEILHVKKIKESQRSLLISGILIALKNQAFEASFKKYRNAQQLANSLVSTVTDEIKGSDLPQNAIESLRQAFSFIQTHSTLSKDMVFFQQLIMEIYQHINSFIKTYEYFDTLGQFYIEFLRYANNDKGLGIVLTPPHITELFSLIANVNKESVIIDNTCGTGGFIISAMRQMVIDAAGDSGKIFDIKKKQLIGIEYQDDIYALAITNMILHDDGKTNIYQGDCFRLVEAMRKKYKPNIGFLNPPYKTKKSVIEELEFVLNNLEMLQPGGTCVAIVPMSSVLAQKGIGLELKRKLLSKHTLEAVMSMPGELFHNSKIGVITSIIVITAHTPHPVHKKTWFGYWRDDGFVKTKNRGRIDLYDRWPAIRDHWIEIFHNREVHDGESLMQIVSAKDEWCAEAYMETDYSKLNEKDFVRDLKKFVLFKKMELE